MQVTLTFDNGPDAEVTPQVLDILRERAILATFFVLGQNVATVHGRDIVAAAHVAGHRIGNHTYSHSIPFGELADETAAIAEVERTQALIAEFNPEKLFRPFGGGGHLGPSLLNPAIVEHLQAQRYSMALWSSVPGDWLRPDSWDEAAKVDVLTREWSVLVLHDIQNAALARLSAFLDWLIGQGCAFSQDFPTDCMPLKAGRVIQPLDHLVRPAS